MKIGIDARMIKATGIGRYIASLIEELSKIDKKNQYILFLRKEDFFRFKLPGKNFKKVLADFHWYGLSEQTKFPRFIEEQNLDLMHFPHFNVPLKFRGKFIITIHDLTLHRYKTIRASTKSFLTYQVKHLLYKKIIKSAIKKSLNILTPSNFTRKDILDIFKVPEEKITVTYEGGPSNNLLKKIPNDKILKKFNLKRPFILYVGNAYPHKNLDNLLNSLKYIPSNVHLVLVGKKDDFYEKLEKLSDKNDYSDRVIFTGFVTDEDLVALYKDSSAFIFPSLNEGFGLPALEAQNFGLPVLTSNRSSLPEILGNSALYFNPLKPKDIAEKIKKVLNSKEIREGLVLKGYNKIKEYSWAKMARETLKVYEESAK